MNDYQVYILGSDGRVVSAVDIECPYDEAKKLMHGRDVELWQRDRKIETFKRKSLGSDH
jgi:hypothetical protein